MSMEWKASGRPTAFEAEPSPAPFARGAIHANLTVCSWLGECRAGIIAAEKMTELEGFRDCFPE